MISNCGHDERWAYRGGSAGDQTGTEWQLVPWYDYKPWDVMLRYPDENIRHWMGEQATAAAMNDCIGYDQGQRQTFWANLADSNYDASKITVKCEADCSSGVLAIAKAAGYHFGIEKLKNIDQNGYTGTEEAILVKAGFVAYRDQKYLKSDAYLDDGDILLNTHNHTAFNVSVGSKYVSDNDKVPVNEKNHLNGIDIASYQHGINTQAIEADFIIVKATQGNYYKNPDFKRQIDGAISGGKIVGIYHYATGSGVDGEVDCFLDAIKEYIGKAFLCLDWETSEYGRNTQFHNPQYAKYFMDKVKERTGLTMFIYGSKDACFNAMDWSAVRSAGYPLWGAQYKDYMPVYGYQDDPWESIRPWGAWEYDVAIHQYTSVLQLSGYNGNLDGNICYLTAEQLKAYTVPLSIEYRAHCQTYGWMDWKCNGQWSGTKGEKKRLEALNINPPKGVELEVTVHLQKGKETDPKKYGDVTYKGIVHGNKTVIGTTGESRRIEGISIKCTKNNTGKKLKYQVHCQTYGDTKICSEGEFCGTRGESKRLEAIRIWFE